MDIISQLVLSKLLETKLLLIFVEELISLLLGESELAVTIVCSIKANFILEKRSFCQ